MTTAQAQSAELLFGKDREVAAWVNERIPDSGRLTEYTAIGVTLGDRMIAGFLYFDYRKKFRVIEMGMAADTAVWAKPGIIKAALSYPFDQLDCYKVRAVLPMDQERAIKTMFHIGFEKDGILAHEFGKKRHAVVLRMLKPNYQKIYGGI